MNIDNLVKMANQIARFFEPWADRTVARDEVANHPRRFWSPRMRKVLIEHVARGTREHHVAPLVTQAVAELDKGARSPARPLLRSDLQSRRTCR